MRFASAVLVGSSLTLLLASCGTDSRVIPPPPEPANYADPCAAPADCVGGLSCVAGLPATTGGLCTADCTTATCPEGGQCADVLGSRWCLAPCATGADCGRDDLQCFRGVCTVRCGIDADCGADALCEAGQCSGGACTLDSECGARGVCTAGRCATRPLAGEGEACASAADCSASLVCLPASAGGVCARTCANTLECGDRFSRLCSPLGVDTNGDGTLDAVASVCTDYASAPGFTGSSCASDADCATRACVDGACTEVCNAPSNCLLGHECLSARTRPGLSGTFSGCGNTPVSATTIVDLPLGTPHLVADSTVADFTFAVPTDAVSLTLIAQQTSSGDRLPITFVNVSSPTRESLFSIYDLNSWIDTPIRWIPSGTEEVAAMLIPNTTTDRVTFRAGPHQASVSVFGGAADVRVFARIKRAPGARVTSGTLDLNIFSATTGVTAANAASNARLTQALDTFWTIYAGRGVTRGTIHYYDVTGTAFRNIDTTEGPTSELSQLFAQSAGRTEQAINLFLVDSFSGMRDGFTLLGVAGGIPGPPGVHGTGHSGVVVSFPSAAAGSASNVGQTIAHELGHFLGLYHNSESVRACAAGTGPTATLSCAPFGGGDVLADTSPTDTANLMYWAAMGGTSLSNGQGYVMLRSAIVR
jgi:hypothetical protein